MRKLQHSRVTDIISDDFLTKCIMVCTNKEPYGNCNTQESQILSVMFFSPSVLWSAPAKDCEGTTILKSHR